MLTCETLVTVISLVDAAVEIYLKSVIKPFLVLHETFYSGLNRILRKLLDDSREKIPDWFTANFITYLRTVVVIPTILLLAWGHTLLPAILVAAVDFGDFLDGVVARFWVDMKKERAEAALKEKKGDSRSSPTNSEDDSFEVIMTGSPRAIPSWIKSHRNRTYGGFLDANCDKAFVVPCWVSLLHVVPNTSYVKLLQYVTFICLILAESASACIRFKAYFTSGGVPAPSVQGYDFSSSAVKADHIGKAKQTFEMVGTALFIIPVTRYAGVIFLTLAVPLAYESVRRKVNTRAIYVQCDKTTLDHKVIRFWMQSKAMGSKLIVGVSGGQKKNNMTEMVRNACAISSVDEVMTEAPSKVDLMFLEKQKIDFCVMFAGQSIFVTDEVVNSQRVLVIGDDGVAMPHPTKSEKTE